jgi:uncharacterized protein (TIGR02302 family)
MVDMKYRLLLSISFLNLLYERAWSRFWPALSVLFFYAALVLMNVVEMFGSVGKMVLMAFSSIGFLGLLLRYGKDFRFPTSAEVARKMEGASALTHRPLSSLQDQPVESLNAESRALWDKHIRRMATMLEKLTFYRANPDTSRQDRYALRHAALILLVIGMVVAGNNAGGRLVRGFTPPVSFSFGKAQTDLDVWITPPTYVHLTPVFISSSQAGAAVTDGMIIVPEGSVLKVRIANTSRLPHLRYAGQPYVFSKASANSYILELSLNADGMLRIRQGVRELGLWKIETTKDAPPDVSLIEASPTSQGGLKIAYTAKDDYGIVKMTGTVSPPADAGPEEGGKTVDFDMPAPQQGHADNTFTADLSSNMRAGFPALLILTVTDGAGQSVSTEPAQIVLPERVFSNPLARQLIEQRKKIPAALTLEARRAIANNIAEAGGNPALYKGDIVVFMAIGSAVRRLSYDLGAAESVETLLWDIALKLEDGGLTTSARDLHEALQKLSQSLKDKNVSKAELQKQLDDVQKKMQDYMRTFMNELAQSMQGKKNQSMIPPELAQKFMKSIDLGEMMRQMQQMSQDGSREAMQKMADFLKKAVENLNPERMGKMKKEQMQAMQALQDMQEIVKRQQALVEKTTKLAPGARAAEEKKEQDALRGKLGDAIRKLGENMKELPPNLPKADLAMKDAQSAFDRSKPKESLPHQKEAAEELQKGVDSSVKALAKNMQQIILSFGFSKGGSGGYGEGFDPLGRGNEDGQGKGGNISIPDQKERRRVQEIIDELRNRSNEYQRPKIERDYLDRLLDQMN